VIENLAAVADEVNPSVRPGTARPIAIVGAGAIVDVAHLPAYRAGALEVVGLTDLDLVRAAAVAARHGVSRVYHDLAELLADDEVEVVDIAVPGPAQPSIAERALRSGRHVLAQKPFAPDAATGRRLADLADEVGVGLAVNQQLRFDEGIAAAHAMMRRGWLGEVYRVIIDVRIHTDWSAWPWLLTTPRLEISNHSIHYHDIVRWFLGEPRTVFCAGGRAPGQAAVGETSTITSYLFASGARALVQADHNAAGTEPTATFRIEGTEGVIRGTLGLLYDYPHGRPDTLEIRSSVLGTDGWLTYPVSRRWVPDAFLGPMASLLDHVGGGPVPVTSAHDNVRTLELVDAIYASQATGEAQRVGRG
jgi:predicted dehydrogenase